MTNNAPTANNLKTTTAHKSGCIATSLKIIGDKWTALLLKELLAAPKRFSELQRQLPSISPRTLSQRLSHLETNKIIIKLDDTEPQNCTKYGLTDKGKDLWPIIEAMSDWGNKYMSDCD